MFKKLSSLRTSAKLVLFVMGVGVVACSSSPKNAESSASLNAESSTSLNAALAALSDEPRSFRGMHSGMEEVGGIYGRLTDSRASGWIPTEGEDGVQPVLESKRLELTFRALQGTKGALAEDRMRGWLVEAEGTTAELHQQLKGGDIPGAEATFVLLTESCERCHESYL